MKNSIAPQVNGGDFWQGSDFSITTDLTPIINDQVGPIKNATYGLYTGSFATDDISKIRIVNGQAYVNKLFKLWNG
jgi:hypothetical protein